MNQVEEKIINEAVQDVDFSFREQMALNARLSRSNFIKSLLDPRRDIDDECGYPGHYNITEDDYQLLYDREGIATRVVEIWPTECWKVQPRMLEDEDTDEMTAFEQAWNDLGKTMVSEEHQSWYSDERNNTVWEALKRIDILSGIGQYGVLLLGISDGKQLREPARPSENNRLLFLRTFPETLVQITQWDNDETSPRFGKPTMYQITFADPSAQKVSGQGMASTTREVHHSRVIHVAETLTSSEVLAVPRMRPGFNRLMDLRKLYGACAEMYWRGAFPGLSLETHPQLGGDVSVDTSNLREMMENYSNGLQRYLALMGMSAKSLAPQVSDPSAQIRVQLEALCILIGVPLRKFLGSERGELASSEDKNDWNGRLSERHENYLTPRLIAPFADRLIWLKILPEPESYTVRWPDMSVTTPVEEAQVTVHRTEAMSKYVAGGVDSLIAPYDFLVQVVGFEPGEAEGILEQAEEHVEEKEEEQRERMEKANQDGQAVDDNGVPLPPQFQPQNQPQQGNDNDSTNE